MQVKHKTIGSFNITHLTSQTQKQLGIYIKTFAITTNDITTMHHMYQLVILDSIPFLLLTYEDIGPNLFNKGMDYLKPLKLKPQILDKRFFTSIQASLLGWLGPLVGLGIELLGHLNGSI